MPARDIHGSYTALVTPFKNGSIDEAAYADFIEWQIAEGAQGIVPCGTTGESPTLSHDEHNRLVEIAVEAAKGRVPVMAGTGSNSTAEAIAFTQHAQAAGAESALIVAPYYNKPTQEGLFHHYKAIHDATELPLVIYNIPARSVIDIADDTFVRLAELPRIAAAKDATGDLARVSTLRHRVGDRLALLSGEDMTAIAFNAMGGRGCISVTANVMPKALAALQSLTLAGKYGEALGVHEPMIPLHLAMFCETNPAPAKYALHRMGKMGEEIRLPLMPLSNHARQRLDAVLASFGLI